MYKKSNSSLAYQNTWNIDDDDGNADNNYDDEDGDNDNEIKIKGVKRFTTKLMTSCLRNWPICSL